MPDLVLRKGRIVLKDRILEGDIAIEDGRIKAIKKNIPGEEAIDVKGCLILPGLIDSHVHFREPGFSQKEDWKTGSSAAAAGGVATVLDMPNTDPATVTRQALEAKRSIAESKSLVDYGFHFGSTLSNTEEIRKVKNIASVKFFRGSSTGSMLVDDDLVVLEQFKILCKKRIPASVHAEDESMIKRETERLKDEGRMDALAHSEARPREAAINEVERTLKLSSAAKNRLHLCHITTKEEIALVRKRKNRRLTCEVTPHHLFLTKEDYKKIGNLGNVNPPLREKRDTEALWKALMDGTIDAVASDHAPHLLKEKEGSVWEAASGVPGTETMLPLLLNEVNKRRISINLVAKITSENPARIFGIKNKGLIKKGYDADLVVVDMKKEKKITADMLFTKCGWSPYEGWKLRGWPKKTFVRGKMVFDEGNINMNKGKEVYYVVH